MCNISYTRALVYDSRMLDFSHSQQFKSGYKTDYEM